MSNARNLSQGDTRFVNTSGDTMTGDLSVTSGNVGIGTGSSYPLTVQAGTVSQGNTHALALRNDSTANRARLGFLQQDSTTDAYTSIDGDGRSTGYLRFNTNDTERMRVDSAGRVTMPYQPSFCYWMGDSGGTTYNPTTNGATVIFRATRSGSHNVGNHYSTTNGRFTAPVSGVYQFNLHYISSNSTESGERNYGISLNAGYPITDARARGYTEASGHISINVLLSANDYVQVYKNDGSGSHMYPNGHYSYFSGHLLR